MWNLSFDADEREFDYLENSEKGPSHWGDLKMEWSACKKWSFAVPSRLVQSESEDCQQSWRAEEDIQALRCHSQESRPWYFGNQWSHIDVFIAVMNWIDAILINSFCLNIWQLKWHNCDAGLININGTEYSLQQVHWHSPSEHTINGARYALELHMVHHSTDPNFNHSVAVIGLLHKLGAPDAFLSKVTPFIPKMNPVLP